MNNERLEILYSELAKGINEVSYSRSLKELFNNLDRHLNSRTVPFDYYTIAMVDKLKNRIKAIHGCSKDKEINPKIWTDNVDYSLTENHILSFVLKENTLVQVNRKKICRIQRAKKVFLNPVETRQLDVIFNEPVYRDNPVLECCNRLFVPIISQSNYSKTPEVIGVFQVGGNASKMKSSFDMGKVLRLKLYVDNLAQVMSRLNSIELSNSLNEVIDQVFWKMEKNEHNYPFFLNTCFEKLTKKIVADQFRFRAIEDGNITGKTLEAILKGLVDKKRITRQFVDLMYSATVPKQPTFDQAKFPKRLPNMIVPIKTNEHVFGFVELWCRSGAKPFSAYTFWYVNKYVEAFSKRYAQLRFNSITSRMVVPLKPVEEPTALKQFPFAEFLQEYFDTSYLSYWEMSYRPAKKKSSHLRKIERTYETEKVRVLCQEDSRKTQVSVFQHPILFSNIGAEEDAGFHVFRKFAKKNGFSSFIAVPTISNKRFTGMLVIYLRYHKPDLSPYDSGFLSMVRDKFSAYRSNQQYFNSVVGIHALMGKNSLSKIFDQIAKKATGSLDVDIAFCFKVNEDGHVYYSDGYHSGHFYQPMTTFYNKNEKKNIPLIEKVIQSRKTVWLSTQWEIESYFNKFRNAWDTSQFSERFWVRERINSCAVIQLTNDKNSLPLACMILNFRREQDFDSRQRGAILVFAQTMSNAVTNNMVIERVEREKNYALNQLAEYDDLIKEILPKATRTSFYEILQGVNHEVKNLLIRMTQCVRALESEGKNLSSVNKALLSKRKTDLIQTTNIIQNLVKLFDFRQVEPTFHSVNDLISGVVKYFKTGENDEAHFNLDGLDPSIPDVYCIPVEISMVIYNLTSNAIDALREKKCLKETTPAFNGEITFRTTYKNGEVVIRVIDNGIGVPSQNRSKIFEAGFTFSQHKIRSGTGIGLAFVQFMIENQYLGRVYCYRHAKKTVFRVNIPNNKSYPNII